VVTWGPVSRGVIVATIDGVSLDIAVVLGTTAMPVHQVLRLGRGAIIELDASEDDEVTILANNLPVAKGAVVVSGNRIAVEVREKLPRPVDGRERPPGSAEIPRPAGLVASQAICYIQPRLSTRPERQPFPSLAVVAELVDALA
jgi:flagellar motor switch protein FliN/FliY